MSEIQANVTSDMNATTDQAGLLTAEQARARTQILRDAIRNRVTALIEQGSPFVRIQRQHSKANAWLRSSMEESARGYYKCRCCSDFFQAFSKIGYVTEQGGVRDILSEVFNEVLGTDFKVRAEILGGVRLNIDLTNAEKGGFTHYYAFTEDEINRINETYLYDEVLGDILARQFFNKKFDPRHLAQFIADYEDKITNKTAFGVAKQLLEFMRENVERDISAGAAIVLTNMPKYAFLRHIRSTAAYTTLLTNFVKGVPYKKDKLWDHAVDDFNRITDPEVYQKKIAEANAQNILQMQKTLHEIGCEHILERRLASVDDVELSWKLNKDEPVAEDTEQSVMDRLVAKAIKKKENTEYNYVVGNPQHISLAAFREIYRTAKRMCVVGRNLLTGFVTAPVKEGNYSEVLKCNEKGVYSLRFLNPINYTQGIHEVSGVFEESNDGTTDNMIMLITDSANDYVNKYDFSSVGSCVIGQVIKGKYEGISRPLAQLSEQVPLLPVQEGKTGVAFFGIGPNSIIGVMDQDGIWKTYDISSLK